MLPFLLAALLSSGPALALSPEEDAAILQIEAQRLPPLALRTYVESEDADTRLRAARALGRLRSAASLPPLGALLSDPSGSVRAEAAWALGLTPGADRLLLDHLDTETVASVRVRCVRALGTLQAESAVPLLLELLHAPGTFARQPPTVEAAARALGRMAASGVEGLGSDEVVGTLVGQRNRLDAPTRLAAAFALARIRRPDPVPSVREDLLTWAQEEPRADVRSYLARGLGTLTPGQDVRRAVATLLSDPDVGVQVNAVRAAAALGSPRVKRLLDHPEAAVRREAIAAVVSVPALDPHTLLDPIVEAGSQLEAEEAARAAGDPRLLDAATALRALAEAGHLEDPEPYLEPSRPTAIRVAALEAVDLPLPLRTLAAEDGEARVRTAAAARLLALDGLSSLHARTLLGAFDPMVASLAASWLADHPDRRSEGALLELVEESTQSDVLVASLQALEALYGGARPRVSRPATRLLPFLEPLASHPDRQVRSAAEALAEALDEPFPDTWHAFAQGDAAAEVLADVRSARVETTQGTFVVALHPDAAPLTVANFVKLAERDWFDNLRIHRVVADFVVQDGDPRGDGTGGPGWSLPDELSPLRFDEGTVGMALSGPDTGGSQWFVTLSPQPHLDDSYPIFGQVVRGMSVVHSLTTVDRIKDVVIERAAPFPSESRDAGVAATR